MHILSSYSTFPPATFQNNLSFNYILMAYHVTAKLFQHKFNSGNLLNLRVLRWLHGVIMSAQKFCPNKQFHVIPILLHYNLLLYKIWHFYHKVNDSHKICHLTAALLVSKISSKNINDYSEFFITMYALCLLQAHGG